MVPRTAEIIGIRFSLDKGLFCFGPAAEKIEIKKHLKPVLSGSPPTAQESSQAAVTRK